MGVWVGKEAWLSHQRTNYAQPPPGAMAYGNELWAVYVGAGVGSKAPGDVLRRRAEWQVLHTRWVLKHPPRGAATAEFCGKPAGTFGCAHLR